MVCFQLLLLLLLSKKETQMTSSLIIYILYVTLYSVTTPEKWDSMTRRWTDYKEMMKYITLFVVIIIIVSN